MLNGLDLFSGIGGITIALEPWVKPVAYCENDRYAQAVLLSRMSEGKIPIAPIWDDIKTLRSEYLPEIDIIYGGFPCQDISVAGGSGKGLEGERSGLFFEIVRLAKEIKPSFVFLENVPAIRTRGLADVGQKLAEIGYDCRWDIISAYDVGAPHLRERWFLLAHAISVGRDRKGENFEKSNGERPSPIKRTGEISSPVANASSTRDRKDHRTVQDICHKTSQRKNEAMSSGHSGSNVSFSKERGNKWWDLEPDVGRVANGIHKRLDRLKGLGNAVVPEQAREALKRLAGIEIHACKKSQST